MRRSAMHDLTDPCRPDDLRRSAPAAGSRLIVQPGAGGGVDTDVGGMDQRLPFGRSGAGALTNSVSAAATRPVGRRRNRIWRFISSATIVKLPVDDLAQ